MFTLTLFRILFNLYISAFSKFCSFSIYITFIISKIINNYTYREECAELLKKEWFFWSPQHSSVYMNSPILVEIFCQLTLNLIPSFMQPICTQISGLLSFHRKELNINFQWTSWGCIKWHISYRKRNMREYVRTMLFCFRILLHH